ncbi:MAG: hypothetical protein OYH77_07380 [Pseudomonadota bacterium]|nr:hypothetical protein [Pseudomonadota bacterium]
MPPVCLHVMLRLSLAWLCVAILASCKPMVRQESSSPQFVEIAGKLKRLTDAKAYAQLRMYVAALTQKNRTAEVGRAIGIYLNDGLKTGKRATAANVRAYLRSYTHSAVGTVVDADIKSLTAQIAVSQNERQVLNILAELEDKIKAMKTMYGQRNRVLNSVSTMGKEAGEVRYSLLIDARDDFHRWYAGVIDGLHANLAKYQRRMAGNADLPEEIRSRVVGWQDDFEAFYRSIGIRSDTAIN